MAARRCSVCCDAVRNSENPPSGGEAVAPIVFAATQKARAIPLLPTADGADDAAASDVAPALLFSPVATVGVPRPANSTMLVWTVPPVDVVVNPVSVPSAVLR